MSPLQAKIHFTLHTNIYNGYVNNMAGRDAAGQRAVCPFEETRLASLAFSFLFFVLSVFSRVVRPA